MDVIKLIQAESFPTIIHALSLVEEARHKHLSRSSLGKLCPYMHDGLLRVGGRLSNSAYDFDMQHPIILPKNHHVVSLIIKHYHEAEGHSGVAHILSAIRRRFWIVHGRVVVKK